ncbi:rRNA maturation RNase YbeY [soil metagenome]
MTNVDVITYIESHYPVATKALKEAVVTTIRHVAPARADMIVNVSVIGDRKMKQLNKQYRDKDHTTNVLSFSYTQDYTPDELKFKKIHLGEIVLSYPEIIKKAIEDDTLVEAAAQFLTVHGTLHLLGYDHEEAHEAYAMEKFEDEIMNILDPQEEAK